MQQPSILTFFACQHLHDEIKMYFQNSFDLWNIRPVVIIGLHTKSYAYMKSNLSENFS